MSLSICVCVPKPNVTAALPVIEERLKGRFKNLFVGLSPSDFASFKEKENESCALIVETNAAESVIRYLCDDYAAKSRRVKFIYSLSAGVDSYNLPTLQKELNGVPLYNARGCYDNPLAEHVLFSIGYFNRQCWRFTANKHAKSFEKYVMKEVRTQKAAIIGYGSIGQATGKLCAAMGMEVKGFRRVVDKHNPSVKELVDEHGVTVLGDDARDAAIAEADFVIGVLPGTPATTKFFNKSVFDRMKKSAVFINIGRGVTQNEVDLVEALRSGSIAGAALDVFEKEPLPEDSPLWGLPDDKLLLTPHCADWTDQLVQTSIHRFAGIFSKLISGEPLHEHTVDISKGY